jgi:hypothetical protein
MRLLRCWASQFAVLATLRGSPSHIARGALNTGCPQNEKVLRCFNSSVITAGCLDVALPGPEQYRYAWHAVTWA